MMEIRMVGWVMILIEIKKLFQGICTGALSWHISGFPLGDSCGYWFCMYGDPEESMDFDPD